jgi:hypothetical protein
VPPGEVKGVCAQARKGSGIKKKRCVFFFLSFLINFLLVLLFPQVAIRSLPIFGGGVLPPESSPLFFSYGLASPCYPTCVLA